MPDKLYTLVTGASEGLGKAFALECAKRGRDLVLVALAESGLDNLAAFIRKNFPVSVLVFEMDLSDPASCQMLFAEVNNQSICLQMLINNAGIGSTISFSESSIEFYERQIKLNVLATTIITRLFIGNLECHTPSYILNVGSMASFFFLPRKQVYGATKSYIHYFSKSLRKEVRRNGIQVSVLCPGGINTNLSVTLLNRTGSWLSQQAVLNPERVAEIAMNGLLKGKPVIIPGTINNLFMFLDKILPEFIKNPITRYGINKLRVDGRYAKLLKKGSADPVGIGRVA
jgi:uncharacterized protein